MLRRGVVLLSGGLDSAVALAVAARECDEVYCLTVRYGQRHAIEVACAAQIARAAGAAEHRILDVDLASWGGSSLTGEGEIPKDRSEPDREAGIPPTYVPARNTVLLALALAWAEVLGAEGIYIGAHEQDAGGYPDTRPEFLAAFQRMADCATRAGTEGRGPAIRAPLIGKSKAEVIALGRSLGVDFARTSSCYDPLADGSPCGRCDACRIRARGFSAIGLPDPRTGGRG